MLQRLILIANLALLLGLPRLAYCNTGSFPSVGPTQTAAAHDEAPLVLYNREIMRFRASLLGISPAERARRAAANLTRQLGQGGRGEVSVEVLAGDVRAVKLDGVLAFMVLPADADALSGEHNEAVAARAAEHLRQVVSESREVRSLRAMLIATGLAALATLLLALGLRLLAAARRRTAALLLRAASEKARALRLAGQELVQREILLLWVRRAVTLLHWFLALMLIYEWLGFALGRFPYTRPWGERLQQFLLDAVLGVGGGLLGALPGLLIACLIVLVAKGVTDALRGFFDRVEAGSVQLAWLDSDTVRPTRRLVAAAVWLFALAAAYPYLPGAQTEAFKGLSVLVGLMISLGASSLVGQAASGLILMYTRSLRAGEYVRIGETEGTVMELGMFTTRIRTGMGEEVTLPNSLILSNTTRNYSRAVKGAGYIVDTVVTIGYDTPWRQVQAMLLQAAARTPGVLADPAPRVFQTALSDFYPEYRLVCQAVPERPLSRAEVLASLHANIQDVFNEYGVQIMSPHYLADPAQEKRVPPTDWYRSPAVPPEPQPGSPP